MEDLLVVSSACRSTICCRCRPDQKKMMVSLVRNGIPSARTLGAGAAACVAHARAHIHDPPLLPFRIAADTSKHGTLLPLPLFRDAHVVC
jgi:hypothetical protein